MSPATTLGPAASPSKGAPDKDATPRLLIPFTRAAKEHTESFMDVNAGPLGASSVTLEPKDLPAYGYARGIELLVTLSGGTGAAAVASADKVFAAIHELSIQDVNGQTIVGPISGHDLYLINKYGGYGLGDPQFSPGYSAINAAGNGSFKLWIPLEISQRDALGCLGNQNAASTYKLRITQAASTAVYATPPTTLPTQVNYKAWLSAWSMPLGSDLHGNPQATEPPAHGTTQFWTKSSKAIAGVGQGEFRQTRVGNQIRSIILVGRDVAGARTNGIFPNPTTLSWDTRVLHERNLTMWKDQMYRRTGYSAAIDTAGGLDTGVYVEDFCHEFDGKIGLEMRDGWLSTVQGTRLDFTGSFGAAGNLYALVNDVSPAGEVFV